MSHTPGPCIDHGYKGGKDGYAIAWVDGKQVGRHRIAYCKSRNKTLADISGAIVRHLCDNPRCVNPNHLDIGTIADNHRDRIGKSNISKVLTAQEVSEMRRLYTGEKGQQKFLANLFGVNRTVAHRIVKGTRR